MKTYGQQLWLRVFLQGWGRGQARVELGEGTDARQGQEVFTHLERETESPSSPEVPEVPEGSGGGAGKEGEVCDIPGGPPCQGFLGTASLYPNDP